MRIACLQFAPQLDKVIPNLERADDILERADPQEIDLLILPELALCGYNFTSLRHIWPHFESATGGISAAWARQTSLRYDCTVVMGYPEKVDGADDKPAEPVYYNAALIMNGDGDMLGNHRKAHLFHTDETWALEGQRGFYAGRLGDLGQVAVGISMDINPYKFEAAWDDYEFSHHVVDSNSRLVVLTMAWSTDEPHDSFLAEIPEQPDMDTLLYWINRLQPILEIDADDQETTIVFCNRCGFENDATYVGTSTILGIKRGEVLLHGILGRGEEELLVVDTELPPRAKLLLRSQGPGLGAAAVQQHEDGLSSIGLLDPKLPAARQRRTWSGSSRRPREHASRGPYRTQGSIVVVPLDTLRPAETHHRKETAAAAAAAAEREYSVVLQHEHHPRNGTPASRFSVSTSSEDSDGDGDDEGEDEEPRYQQPIFRRRLPFAPTYNLRIPGTKVESDWFKPPVLAPRYHHPPQRPSDFAEQQLLTTDDVALLGYLSEATPIVDSPMSAMSFFADEGVGKRNDMKTPGPNSTSGHKHRVPLQDPSRRPKAASKRRQPLRIIIPRNTE